MGVSHKGGKRPWVAKMGSKYLGRWRTQEEALFARCHHEMHEVGVRPGRVPDMLAAGISEEVIEKFIVGDHLDR